jgi:transposase
METLYFLGIDISKKKLDTALTADGKHFHEVQIENRSQSLVSFFKDLKKQLSSLDRLVICIEHTGIYGQPLLDVAVKLKLKISVESALHIKQSQGLIRGKNDTVDARRIAVYAFKNKEGLILWKPQRDCIQKLKALLVTRDRLIMTKVQLEVPTQEATEFIDPSIRKEMIKHSQRSLSAIQKDIAQIDSAIEELVKSDEQLSKNCELATSVPGIGKITALNMIVSTGEFERIREAKKFACYAGVAPFEHSSGSSIRGKTRVSKMANMTMKRLLHMAAMSAIQCCDELKIFYNRKVEAGKNKMSIINAVRNKLIGRVFACITHKRKYEKIYQYSLA